MNRLKKVVLAVLSCFCVNAMAIGMASCDGVMITPNGSGGFLVTPTTSTEDDSKDAASSDNGGEETPDDGKEEKPDDGGEEEVHIREDGTVCEGVLNEYGVCEICWYISENHTHDLWEKPAGSACEDHYLFVGCNYCEYYEEKFVEGIGHSYTEQGESVEPSCEQEGHSSLICEYCWSVWIEVDVVPALGHKIVNYEGKEPTCTAIGWYAYETCENCSYTTYQERAELGHSYTNYVSNNDATCTEDGTKTATCDYGCGKTDTVADENSARHTYEEGKCILCGVGQAEGLEYQLNEDGLSYSIKGMGTCKESNLIIPSTYASLPVTYIAAAAFSDKTLLKSVVIPDSILGINQCAFSRCASLTDVVVGNSVVYISDMAFGGCTALKNLTLPASLESVGGTWRGGAFEDCVLENVYFNGEIKDWCKIMFETRDAQPLTPATNFYIDNKPLDTDLVIPNTVTYINRYVFKNCANLQSIKIPETVTKMENGVFFGCASLVNIELPTTINSIGMDFFWGCCSLTNIVLPTSIVSIGFNAFEGCTSLEEIILPDSVMQICKSAFTGCTSLKNIVIGSSVTDIEYGAFYDCVALTNVYYKGEYWAISVDNQYNYNKYLLNATRYYYSENQPTTEGNYWHYDENGEITVW